jgi:hypothetical protein
MVVTTSAEEQAKRAPRVAGWVERCAIAAHVPAETLSGAMNIARTLPLDDPRLKAAASDWRRVLDILGIDVPPPPPPGTCSGCGRARTLADSASGTPRCQPCMRRLQAGGRP